MEISRRLFYNIQPIVAGVTREPHTQEQSAHLLETKRSRHTFKAHACKAELSVGKQPLSQSERDRSACVTPPGPACPTISTLSTPTFEGHVDSCMHGVSCTCMATIGQEGMTASLASLLPEEAQGL